MYFLGDKGSITSSYTVYDSHRVSRITSLVILMVWKLHLFVNLLNQPVLALNGSTLSSPFDRPPYTEKDLALTKSSYRHMALHLILYPATQHFCHMFHTCTPWKRNSSSGHFSSWPSTYSSFTSINTNCT